MSNILMNLYQNTIFFVQFPWALSMEGPTFQIALESALGGFVMQIRRVFS